MAPETAAHSYYCTHCHILIFGATTERLCENLNSHNMRLHPTDFNQWSPGLIVRSNHYKGTGGALTQYTAPHGTTTKSEWGTALAAPVITEEDTEILKEMHIKW